MTRLKLTLEYDGTGFRGWAAQPGLPTVEGALRSALETVFPRWDELAAAGRTDTGVHALGQVASVEVGGGPPPERAAGRGAGEDGPAVGPLPRRRHVRLERERVLAAQKEAVAARVPAAQA